MKIDEAKGIIACALSCGCSQVCNTKYRGLCDDEKVIEAMQLVCERLQPKKPNERGRTDTIVTCPTCGIFIHIKDRMKYCWECGQALDWSDVYGDDESE